MGYFKNETATQEAFTEDGWLRTGDKGEFDETGRLKITGRTKDIFKTSKGKYVAPAPIECEYISHPMIELACVGGRSYPAAHIIVLLGEDIKKEVYNGRRSITKRLSRRFSKLLEANLPSYEEDEIILKYSKHDVPRKKSFRRSFTEYLKCGGKETIENELGKLLKNVNSKLDEHEALQFIAVVNEEWLPENGLVTPTNKIKRTKIEEQYAPLMDEWYNSKKQVIWRKW